MCGATLNSAMSNKSKLNQNIFTSLFVKQLFYANELLITFNNLEQKSHKTIKIVKQ